MNKVYISLGSNRGDRQDNISKAIMRLNEKAGTVIQESHLYETQPWKMQDHTNFINQVILIETKIDADTLMKQLLEIETRMGRLRTSAKYEPRTIDIDILFFNHDILSSKEVTVPHPFIQERRFILEPLAEIAPDYIHPITKTKIYELLTVCKDNSKVVKLVSK
ncbi:MAG TPA: 2-amino-4-hydroxy-6-hydroxymethyldihydropteridine diphosphokinase [Bacteroidia bacterium]|nr:2-amino-4-hydroxy-6-hydroxymethyldihydropteridine diphosphokinase [Bacteroidia bacterium]